MHNWISRASLIAGLFGLAACNGREQAETPPPQEEATVPEQVVSIMRPDLTVEPAVAEDVPPQPLEVTIPFAEGGRELSDDATVELRRILESEQIRERWPVILRGHTDSVGNDEANLQASRVRAQAVADWLIQQGIDGERITVIALGEQRPIAPNANLDATPFEEGRARNRRVTVTIAPPEPGTSEGEQLESENEAPGELDERA